MDVEANGPTRNVTILMDVFVLEPKVGAVMREPLSFTQIVMVTESLTQYVLTAMAAWASSKAHKDANPNGLMQPVKTKEPHAALAEDTRVGAVMLDLYSR